MHFCKVCNKGFSCGGALGGHMRAHGVEEVINSRNKIEEEEDKIEGNKRPYFLRTTTNRLVSYRAREDCGKSYLTWNSLVEHGNYSLDDTPTSPTGSFKRSTIMEEKYSQTRASREEKDLANFLVMLSNGKVNDHHQMVDSINDDSFTLANNELEDQNKAREVVKGKFQCKACKKVFNSHQALGGHRASHKKVKGCFAAKFDNMDDDNIVHEDDMDNVIIHESPKHTLIDLNHTLEASPLVSNLKKNMKVHECSICHRVFSSGQALGGHKRCHWLTSNMPAETYNSIPQFHGFEYDSPQTFKKAMFEKSEPLDLNLPVLFDDASEDHIKDHNTSKYGALSRIYQMPVAEEENHRKTSTNHAAILDDVNSEENFEMKVAKMSDLREINLFGECSTWLQMGIAPTVEGRTVS